MKARGIYQGKIFGKRLWKMAYKSSTDKKVYDYYLGEIKIPRLLGRLLCSFRRRKK